MHPWAIFVEGLKGWRVNWLKLAGIYLLVYIPLTILDIASELWVLKGTWPGLIQYTGSLFIHWVFDAFVMVSLILSAQGQLNSMVTTARDTMKEAIKFLWRYMLTTLLYSIIVGGFLLLAVTIVSVLVAFSTRAPVAAPVLLLAAIVIIATVVAMVYCAIRLALAGVICIMEKIGPISSLKISHSLIKKKVSPVVGVFFFILLLSALLFMPGSLLDAFRDFSGLGKILLAAYQVFASSLMVPIWAFVVVILYKKLKEVVE